MTLSRKNLGNIQSIYDIQNLPPYRMLFRLAWPVILSMLVQGLYNIIDSIYLSRLGEEVLSAMSLAAVVQTFMAAFFGGIATGMNAVASKALGQNDPDRAKGTVVSGFSLQILLVLGFTAFGIWGVPSYFKGITANEAVIGFGLSYLCPCLYFSFLTASQITFERLLQASGMPRYMMICQIAGFGVNLLLDPMLIFGLLGFPALGCAGAAYATIIGQAIAAALAVLFNIRRNRLLFGELFTKKRFSLRIVGKVAYIGIPSAISGIAVSLSAYVVNRILIGFSTTANAAFGIYAKVESFAIIPGSGFSAALLTLLAFFYGKKDLVKMRELLKACFVCIGSWFWFCAFIFLFFPGIVLAPFHPTPQMTEVGIPAFRIIGSTFLLSGFMFVIGAFLQSIGKSVYSLVITLSRQLLVRIPLAILLSGFRSVSLIWWCWPISEIVSDCVSVSFFVYSYHRIKKENQQETLPETAV